MCRGLCRELHGFEADIMDLSPRRFLPDAVAIIGTMDLVGRRIAFGGPFQLTHFVFLPQVFGEVDR